MKEALLFSCQTSACTPVLDAVDVDAAPSTSFQQRWISSRGVQAQVTFNRHQRCHRMLQRMAHPSPYPLLQVLLEAQPGGQGPGRPRPAAAFVSWRKQRRVRRAPLDCAMMRASQPRAKRAGYEGRTREQVGELSIGQCEAPRPGDGRRGLDRVRGSACKLVCLPSSRPGIVAAAGKSSSYPFCMYALSSPDLPLGLKLIS
eukprot:1160345-Pelagomonas_calceolata.AAC.5